MQVMRRDSCIPVVLHSFNFMNYSRYTNRSLLLALLISSAAWLLLTTGVFGGPSPSFAGFAQRATAGEPLNVVFFGASLTWGANATDPQLTSYRARVARQMEEAYPQAHFTFWDSAIGGTGSQLGVFRLERDVLRHHPDLVFLDFSANDDIYNDTPEQLASYESLIRRIVTEGHAPVVQMILPFGDNIQAADFDRMKRRTAHIEIAKAYDTAVGDAIQLAVERVRSGTTTIDQLWSHDWGHPGDAGYQLFADAAWAAYQDGVKRELVCATPASMLHAGTYLTNARVRLSSLGQLPPGWRRGAPNLTSAFYDMLMSRWLDDEVIASNRVASKNAEGKTTLAPQAVASLQVKFRGTMVMLFGESTLKSGKYRAIIDGKPVAPLPLKEQGHPAVYDSGSLSLRSNGNTHYVQILAETLDAGVDHLLVIEPLFPPDQERELRIESICVAGGGAKVFPFEAVDQTDPHPIAPTSLGGGPASPPGISRQEPLPAAQSSVKTSF